MKQNWKLKCRRIMSGFLAFTMTSILVLGDAGAAFASESSRFFQEASELGGEGYSKATSSNASFKNRKMDDVVMSVFSSSDSDFRAGGTVFLDVHIKNETDSVITEGTLDFANRKLKESGAYFEEPDEDAVTEGRLEEDEEENAGFDSADLVSDLENDLADGDDWEYENSKEAGSDESEEESEAEPEEDEPLQKLEGIELYPGQVYTARFVFDIDEDIEKAKNKNVKFRFRGKNEEGRIQRQEEFQYTVNYVNVDQVRFEDGNEVKTGETVTMGIHASMYNFDGVLSNKKVEEELLASISNAQKATDSNAQAATPANTSTDDDEAFEESEEEDNDTFVVDLGNTTYEIQMINAKLNGFEVREALVDDANENMMICSFRVSKNVQPGIYFGKIIQKNREKHRSYYSTQGFSLIVSGEGDVVLESKVQGSDATVIVTGAASAFPEADQLAVSAREISMDEIDDNGEKARIQEAMAKKALEEGIDIKAFKAMDITLYADGQEIHQMSDDIQVIFQNVEAKDILENIGGGTIQEFSGEEYGGARRMLRAAGIRMEDNIQAMSLDEPGEEEDRKDDEADSGEEWAQKEEAEEESESPDEDDSGEDEQQEEAAEETAEDAAWQGAKTEEEWLASLYADLGVVTSSETDRESGAVESETVQIWHLDEDSQELSEMETVLDESGSATMTTDHFSTYIWVNLTKITGNIKVTVEHFGKGIKTIKGSAKASTGVDTVFKKNGSAGEVQQKTSDPKLYSTDKYTVPNQYYAGSINKLSKVLNVSTSHYTVDHIVVTPSGGTAKTYYYKSGDYYTDKACTKKLKGLDLTKSTTIRFYYKAKTGTLANNVTFYDHNITDGKTYQDGTYLKTSEQGINLPGYFSTTNTSKRMGVGQPDSGNVSPWAETAKYNDSGKFLNAGNGEGIVEGIVTGLDKNGNLKFSKKVNENKYFFAEKGASSKKFTGKLNFKRLGDTYTLTSVSGGKLSASNLQTIRGYANNAVYSNNFWPLDNVSYKGKDPNMGGGTVYHCVEKSRSISSSDDGQAHNWYFGMKYSFKFKVGDYVGPMEYYFRGDDDFWLFIDGEKAIDIGGIHKAKGESLDVEDWLIKKKKLSKEYKDRTEKQKNEEHTVTIYYMERGGFGSCCYMQFTLPNSDPIDPPDISTTSYTVEKKWTDYNNPYRPDSIEVELYQKEGNKNTATGEKATLNEANGWKHTWSELPKKNGKTGTTYVYTAKEVVPKGYIGSNGGVSTGNATKGSITNTLDSVKVKVTKEWKDDSKSLRPKNVQFQLLNSNGTPYKDSAGKTKTITLTEAGGWTGDFTNLPKVNKNGTALSYKVKEVNAPSGYTSGTPTSVTLTDAQKKSGYQSHWKVVNTYPPTSVSVEKKWAGSTPETEKFEVTVGLYQMVNNQPVAVSGQSQKKLNSANGWKGSWTNLKQYDSSGNAITYRPYEIKDGKPLTGGSNISGKNGSFTVSYDTTHKNITNTYHPDKVKVKVTKEWKDDTKSLRPGTVQFQLLNNDGTPYKDAAGKTKTITLTESGGWTGDFTDLPKADKNGTVLSYKVKEVNAPSGYTSGTPTSVTLTDAQKKSGYQSHWKVVNTYPPTSVSVEKKWAGSTPETEKFEVTVGLYQMVNNQPVAVSGQSQKKLNSANGWKGSWTNLKQYDSSGNAITYRPYEIKDGKPLTGGSNISGKNGSFTVSYDTTHKNITNTYHPDKVKVKVTKEWKDDTKSLRPGTVQFQLLNNDGTPYKDAAGKTKTITLTESGGWTGDFTDLPKADKNGTVLSYKVKEVNAPSGYTSGTPVSVTLTSAQIKDGYQSHWKVVNTYASSEIFVEKKWAGSTPETEKFEVTVGLYQMVNNQPVAVSGQSQKKLNSANGWKGSWTNLKQYDSSGKPITYRPYEIKNGEPLKEGAEIPGKNGSFTVNYDASHGEITNVYHPDKVKVKVKKEWAGDTAADRPDEVKFQLLYEDKTEYQDSAGKVYVLTLTAGKNWAGEFTDLPGADEQGNALAYTVKEISEVNGYHSGEAEQIPLTSAEKAQGYESSWKVVNIFSEEEITVSVEKIWDEGTPDEEKSEVHVALYRIAGDTVVSAGEEEKVLTAEGNWKTEWTKLKKYDDEGAQIQYRPYEMDGEQRAEAGKAIENGKFLVGYNEDHTRITNTYNYESLTVKKIWQDYENAYNSRPEKLKVRLLQNGNLYQEQEIIPDAEGNWSHTWTNIPKMLDKETPCVYTVVELDENGEEVGEAQEAQEGSFNSYLYETSYDMNSDSANGTAEKPFIITNKIKPAYLRLRKMVTSDEEAPFIPDFKFLLRLREKESNEYHTIVALGDREISGSILLVLPAGGKEFVIDEVVPMEYEIDGYAMENRAKNASDEELLDGADMSINVNNGDITVYPGDDIIFTVKNKHSHKGYFHHTTSVTNQHEAGEGFGPRNPYSEEPNKDKTDRPVHETIVEETAALWPDKVEEKEEDDVRLA